MNDKPTSVFRWSAKGNRRRSKHYIFAPLRLRVNKIIRRRKRSQCEELVHAKPRRSFTIGEPGWLLFGLTAEDIGTASSLPERNTSASPRLRAIQFFGCAGDWQRYVRAEAQRHRGAEIRRWSRGRAYASEREKVFRMLGGAFLGVSKNWPFFRRLRAHRLVYRRGPAAVAGRIERLGLPA